MIIQMPNEMEAESSRIAGGFRKRRTAEKGKESEIGEV